MYIWRASLVAQMLKKLSEVQETWVWSLRWEDPLEEGMETHFSILTWRLPWTEEPGRLKSMGSQRVGHDWATKHTHTHTYTYSWPLDNMVLNWLYTFVWRFFKNIYTIMFMICGWLDLQTENLWMWRADYGTSVFMNFGNWPDPGTWGYWGTTLVYMVKSGWYIKIHAYNLEFIKTLWLTQSSIKYEVYF